MLFHDLPKKIASATFWWIYFCLSLSRYQPQGGQLASNQCGTFPAGIWQLSSWHNFPTWAFRYRTDHCIKYICIWSNCLVNSTHQEVVPKLPLPPYIATLPRTPGSTRWRPPLPLTDNDGLQLTIRPYSPKWHKYAFLLYYLIKWQ